MNPLLLQLAMGVLTQLGGGFAGPNAYPTLGPQRLPAAYPPSGLHRRPVSRGASEQLATLAIATCQLRGGLIDRREAQRRVTAFGESRGWRAGWARAIPLQRVDAAIRSSGGCDALLPGMGRSPWLEEAPEERPIGSALPRPASPSQAERFGLQPYR